MWQGDTEHMFATSLVVLYNQLVSEFPDKAWQQSGQTGSIGDLTHIAEGEESDHNPWLDNTVRAMDIANVAKGPDCETLFSMVNQMYAEKDIRVYPNGYAIFEARITDPANPGKYKSYSGDDLHYGHCHISTSQQEAGFNSGALWPLPGYGVPESTGGIDMSDIKALTIIKKGVPEYVADGMFIRKFDNPDQVVTFQAWLKARGGDATIHSTSRQLGSYGSPVNFKIPKGQ